MIARAIAVLIGLGLLFAGDPSDAADEPVSIGSKTFTESVILGEIIANLVQETGAEARHRAGLGGTQLLWDALLAGEIDIYPEYTGTITHEILAGEGGPALADDRAIRAALAERGVGMTRPLGFNNTYAMGMRADRAAALDISTVSDLRNHPDLSLGFSNEFMDRGEGWASLRDRYALPHGNVTGLDHDLAYRGLEAGDIDVIDLYSTDAEIAYYGLAVLADDLGHFPIYNAVILYRLDLSERVPGAPSQLSRLEGLLDEAGMAALNAEVKIDRQSEAAVAAAFVGDAFGLAVEAAEIDWRERLWRTTLDHLALVGLSLGAALFLYSLLPIIRNTHAGFTDIPADILEAAGAIGLARGARLRLIELPLAGRAILAGVKTAAVINIGTATLGALIGAGGYGQPILTGIRLDDISLILQGAIPAAVLALAVQGVFELIERLIIPKGLRLTPVD